MKKIITRTLLSALSLITIYSVISCNKIKEAASINVPLEEEFEFDLPVAPAGQANYFEQDIYLNVDSIIKANNAGTGIGNIKSARINSCDIELLNGDDDNNFANVESFKAEFKSDVNSTWTTVAEHNNIPDTKAYTLSVPVNTDIDYSAYFKTTLFSYKASGKLRKETTKELKCKAIIKYTLKVGL